MSDSRKGLRSLPPDAIDFDAIVFYVMIFAAIDSNAISFTANNSQSAVHADCGAIETKNRQKHFYGFLPVFHLLYIIYLLRDIHIRCDGNGIVRIQLPDLLHDRLIALFGFNIKAEYDVKTHLLFHSVGMKGMHLQGPVMP